MHQSVLPASKKLLAQYHLVCLAAMIVILLAPSAIWVLRDQSVWPWDQAVYGEWTLRTWQARYSGPLGWLGAWLHVWAGRPPLIVWIGQFFVPFRYLTGGFESSMLLSNLMVAAGTLIIIYRLAQEYSTTWMETVVALIACGGSTFFVGLTHLYLTELLQCFTTASVMFVASRTERRPLIRTALLMLITVSLSFAAKASSAPFVLPFLVYATLVLIITRGRARPPAAKRDALLFIGAAAIAAAIVAWYVINWEATAAHFIEATTGKVALHYGAPVELPTKLKHWISILGLALSPITAISAAISIVIVVGIMVAVLRLWKVPVHDLMAVAIENGTLFALTLAATILLILLAFSLQVNEDGRYVLPLIPMIAILLSWSLSVLRRKVLTAVFLCALAASTVFVNSSSFGMDIANFTNMPRHWQAQFDRKDALVLTTAVRTTCPPENANRINLFIVDYIRLNAHSANFYTEKDSYTTGYRCYYGSLGFTENDVQSALDRLNAVTPPYVITVAPDRQPPPDFTNVRTKDMTLFLASDPDYALVTKPGDYLQIYRKVR
jgi:4-amino-4-deoxy-L-arabinose transferase-like glycosyltransferase